MITVGYGDIYPVNVEERVFVIVMIFFTTAIFGKKFKFCFFIFKIKKLIGYSI